MTNKQFFPSPSIWDRLRAYFARRRKIDFVSNSFDILYRRVVYDLFAQNPPEKLDGTIVDSISQVDGLENDIPLRVIETTCLKKIIGFWRGYALARLKDKAPLIELMSRHLSDAQSAFTKAKEKRQAAEELKDKVPDKSEVIAEGKTEDEFILSIQAIKKTISNLRAKIKRKILKAYSLNTGGLMLWSLEFVTVMYTILVDYKNESLGFLQLLVAISMSIAAAFALTCCSEMGFRPLIQGTAQKVNHRTSIFWTLLGALIVGALIWLRFDGVGDSDSIDWPFVIINAVGLIAFSYGTGACISSAKTLFNEAAHLQNQIEPEDTLLDSYNAILANLRRHRLDIVKNYHDAVKFEEISVSKVHKIEHSRLDLFDSLKKSIIFDPLIRRDRKHVAIEVVDRHLSQNQPIQHDVSISHQQEKGNPDEPTENNLLRGTNNHTPARFNSN